MTIAIPQIQASKMEGSADPAHREPRPLASVREIEVFTVIKANGVPYLYIFATVPVRQGSIPAPHQLIDIRRLPKTLTCGFLDLYPKMQISARLMDAAWRWECAIAEGLFGEAVRADIRDMA